MFDICPRSLRFVLSNIYGIEAAEPIEVKFYGELLWVGRTKVCSNGHGHSMTNITAMHINGKNA